MKHYLILVLALTLPILSFAQTKPIQRIYLKNGVTINGTVQLMNDGSYEVTTDTGDTFYFLPSEVKRVVGLSESAATSSNGKSHNKVAGNYTGWVIGSGVGYEQGNTSNAHFYGQSTYLGWNFTTGYRFGNFFLGIQSGLGYGTFVHKNTGKDKSNFSDSGFSIPVLLAARYYFSNWKAQPYVHLATGIELVSFSPRYFQLQIGPGVEIHFSPKISMFIEPLYCLAAPFAGMVIPIGFAAHIGVNFYL